MRRAAALVVAIAGLLVVGPAAQAVPLPQDDPFYAVPAHLAGTADGTILRSRSDYQGEDADPAAGQARRRLQRFQVMVERREVARARALGQHHGRGPARHDSCEVVEIPGRAGRVHAHGQVRVGRLTEECRDRLARGSLAVWGDGIL